MADETAGTSDELAQDDITQLLIRWSEGDEDGLQRLVAAVADELRRLARGLMARERIDHTLQPTALVSELYLKLTAQRTCHWENRVQFYAFAAGLMRKILIDHARAKQRARRGGPLAAKVPLEGMELIVDDEVEHILAVNEALFELGEVDPRAARVIELRVFAGLRNREIAEVLEISLATVKRDWRYGSRWLSRRLRPKDASEEQPS